MDFNNVTYGPANWASVGITPPDATVSALGGSDLVVNGTANAAGDPLTATVGGTPFTVFVTSGDTPDDLIITPDGVSFFVLSNTPLSVGQVINFSEGNFGDYVPNPCFMAGTRILTRRGEVAVEDLVAGDEVYSHLSGQHRLISWIGHRSVDCERAARPLGLWPICVRAGAFDTGVPSRDLFLSPDHAVYIGGHLVPVRHLVNGATIFQQKVSRVTYYHVELERHDILLANGLPAESYLDTGNRAAFVNAGSVAVLHADFYSLAAQERRVAGSCAPLVHDPVLVEQHWRHLSYRAEALGLLVVEPETTNDPALCIVADGRQFAPISSSESRYVFALPALQGEARLRSRSVVCSALRPWVDDQRQLGVMIRQIVIGYQEANTVITADDPRLTDGWWAIESDATGNWRWTNGDAQLPVAGGPMLVEVLVGGTMSYPTGSLASQEERVTRIAA